jgi:orotidine-5'-phosphate decarboxylase
LAEPVETFGHRLSAVFDSLGQLCVGIDPHSYLLRQWGLPDTADGVREFGLAVVEATVGSAGIVKPQVAFYERHGSAGFAALEAVIAAARTAGLIVIADAKRGDLGTSVEAYAEAWLTPGGPLEADAMTISAFQGVGSIAAPMAIAEANGKGLFVLAATSNPEAKALQTARLADGVTVAASIVNDVVEWNRAQGGAARPGDRSTGSATGNIGLVLGATVDFDEYAISLDTLAGPPRTPVLAPGFGHQGAQFSDLDSIYGRAASSAVVSASRSILQAGPNGIAEAIATQAAEVLACRG